MHEDFHASSEIRSCSLNQHQNRIHELWEIKSSSQIFQKSISSNLNLTINESSGRRIFWISSRFEDDVVHIHFSSLGASWIWWSDNRIHRFLNWRFGRTTRKRFTSKSAEMTSKHDFTILKNVEPPAFPFSPTPRRSFQSHPRTAFLRSETNRGRFMIIIILVRFTISVQIPWI